MTNRARQGTNKASSRYWSGRCGAPRAKPGFPGHCRAEENGCARCKNACNTATWRRVRGEDFRGFRVRRCNIRFIGLFRKPAVNRRKQEKQREKARGRKRAKNNSTAQRSGNKSRAKEMPFVPNRSLSAAVTQSSICRFVRNRAENPAAKRRKTYPCRNGQKRQMQRGRRKALFRRRARLFRTAVPKRAKIPPLKSVRQNAQRSRAVKVSAAPNTAKRLWGNSKNAPTSKSESVQTGTSALASVFKSFHLETAESGFSRLPETVGRRFFEKD